MSGVYIKGLKMPPNCDACPMLYEYRFCSLTDDHAKSIGWKTEEKRMPNCPLEEAQEQKHGKWEMRSDPYGWFDEIPVCSACGCTTKWREKYSFCPNCGADMRERNEE